MRFSPSSVPKVTVHPDSPLPTPEHTMNERDTEPMPLEALVSTTAAPRRDPRVMLLDDDPFMLGVQARVLKSMGYTSIVCVGSALAALAMLRGDPALVDVIICDLNMPDVDGIEFLQTLKTTLF